MTTSNQSGARITRDNHYLPKFYQRYWSSDGSQICCYRILVPDERVRAWDFRSIKYAGYRKDLYTSTASGVDSDELEKWFGQTVEDPAALVIAKIANGKPLTREDCRHLTLFVMAMEVRTPLSYVRWRERTLTQAQGLLQSALDEVPKLIKISGNKGRQLASPSVGEPKLPLRVRKEVDPNGYITGIGAELTVGREMWFWSIRHVLTQTIRKIAEPRWTVLHAAKDQEWFTSDQPVLRLEYNAPDNFDFGGGWSRQGCEILLPLSPRKLLYCKVGRNAGPEAQLTRGETYEFQRLLALRAWREILARHPVSRVERFRPRRVDLDLYKTEEEMWKRFHDGQTKGHASSESADPLGAS